MTDFCCRLMVMTSATPTFSDVNRSECDSDCLWRNGLHLPAHLLTFRVYNSRVIQNPKYTGANQLRCTISARTCISSWPEFLTSPRTLHVYSNSLSSSPLVSSLASQW